MEEMDFDIVAEKIDIGIWKKLTRYALKHKRLLLVMFFVLIVVAVIDILYPLLQAYLIDNFAQKGTTENIGKFIALYIVVIIAQGLGVFTFISGGGKLEMSISYDIRQDAFLKLQQLSFSFYDKTPVGYLMARMVSDVARLSEMVAWSIIDIFWAMFYLVGVIVSMFVLNWKLALLVIIVIPPLAVLCVFFKKRILSYQRKVRKLNSHITGSFNEGIMGAMTTKTLVREEKNFEEFTVITGDMRRASVRAATISYVFLPLVTLLGYMATALVLYFGGSGIIAGAGIVVTIGTLSAFIAYTMQFFEPIQNIANIFAEMQSAQASAERVLSLIDTQCEIVDSDEIIAKYGDCFAPKRENFEPIVGEVEFRNVSFAYSRDENASNVLTDFNLHIKAGSTIALVGETGAGKSTIINLICRFYEPTSGQILIDGVDYRERSQSWLQSGLGYVLQQPHLFSGSIRDNIAYGKKDATQEEIIAAAKLVHAHDFIAKQDKGYDSEVGEGGIRLSTGQKQLISFARVVLANPSIFVLDEATSSIDTETEQLIQSAIVNVLKNRTSFIVAHRLSTIRNADKILVIRDGKITESGTHDELLAQKGYYYDLYTNQFREEQAGKVLHGKA